MPRQNDLRIVFYDPSGRGGITQYTYQLAESLACKGSRVTVITTEDYELRHLKRSFKIYVPFAKSWVKSFLNAALFMFRKKNACHVDGENIPNTYGTLKQQKSTIKLFLEISRLWVIWAKIIVFLLSRNINIVHFQWITDKKNTLYFMRFLKLLGFNIVYTAHDLLPHDSYSKSDHDIFTNIYGISDKVIVHSNSNKREMVDLFKIKSEKVCVIPHGSFDLFYTDKNLTKNTAREKIGISLEKMVVLFFGSIRRYKGLEYLISAFQKLKKGLDNTALLIVGSIYDEDNEDCKFYSNLISVISHDEDIICVNEYIPFEDINSYFLASDLVVLPYVKTYTSGALLAAYAAGKPVIATDTGSLSEVVDVGKSGFVVPPKDVNALAQAIVEILSNQEKTKKMGDHAKYLSETVYSWNNVALRTIDVYKSLS